MWEYLKSFLCFECELISPLEKIKAKKYSLEFRICQIGYLQCDHTKGQLVEKRE